MEIERFWVGADTERGFGIKGWGWFGLGFGTGVWLHGIGFGIWNFFIFFWGISFWGGFDGLGFGLGLLDFCGL